MTLGKFKGPKVWSQTRMVAYEFEMIQIFFRKPCLFRYSKQMSSFDCQCLVMLTLNIIFFNQQSTYDGDSFLVFKLINSFYYKFQGIGAGAAGAEGFQLEPEPEPEPHFLPSAPAPADL